MVCMGKVVAEREDGNQQMEALIQATMMAGQSRPTTSDGSAASSLPARPPSPAMEGSGRLKAVQRPEKLCLCERLDILHPVTYLGAFFLGDLTISMASTQDASRLRNVLSSYLG